MAKTYAAIQRRIQALQRKAELLKRSEVDGVIARIKEAIVAYDLSAADLGLNGIDGSDAARARGTALGQAAVGKRHAVTVPR